MQNQMPKFTVFFKDKAIDSKIFDDGVIHIGSDDTNDLTVDSLAVAPAHAVVNIKDNAALIKQLNNDFPLIINETKTNEAFLQNNDVINIGKHSIVFSETESINHFPAKNLIDSDVANLNNKLDDRDANSEATLQMMNGPHIGRILTLKKTMTRIGNKNSGVVIITRRKEGYFIAALDNQQHQKVNAEPLGDKAILLHNNDIIAVDNTQMQFFIA